MHNSNSNSRNYKKNICTMELPREKRFFSPIADNTLFSALLLKNCNKKTRSSYSV